MKLAIAKVSTLTFQYIKEDSKKVSLWKRDTDAIIKMLQERKEQIKYGEWGKYIEGIGMNRKTAHNLLNPVTELCNFTQVDKPQKPDNKPTAPPHYQMPEQEIQDIEHEEIIQTAEQKEKEFNKEHTPPELKLPKNMPEEYWVICSILDKNGRSLDLYDRLINRKQELERIHNNNYPEHKEFYDLYFRWFEKLNNEKPNMMAKDHANAKRIIIYLRGLGGGDAVHNWDAILSNWSKLDKWQQNRTDLTSIHTDMNKIISQLKNGKGNNNENVLREVMRNAGHEGY